MSTDREMDIKDVIHICSGTLLSHKKENAICNNMDGFRDYHTKSVRQRTTNIICHSYVKSNFKMIWVNLITRQKQTCRFWKQICGYPRGNMGRKGLISSWNEHTCHYILYRIDNKDRNSTQYSGIIYIIISFKIRI